MSNYQLLLSLTRREVFARYRGSFLGIIWSMLNPLFMLAVYTLVFGVVMKSRWQIPSGTVGSGSTAEFAVILFGGLLLFQFFSDVAVQSTGLVIANANYVKKIVFPLSILPVVTAGAALFHAVVSIVVLLCFVFFVFGRIPATACLIPVIFLPLFIMVIGFGWILASIGVYFRDMIQIVQPLVTAAMFLSPVLFPAAAVPPVIRSLLFMNPLTVPVEAFRAVAIFGTQPDWTALGYYSLVAIVVALLGEQFFQKTRRGFADVL